jgi:hypothetical protein
VKCLVREFDDLGRMFFCELERDHVGKHHREKKSGYPRAYVRIDGVGHTFHQLKRLASADPSHRVKS